MDTTQIYNPDDTICAIATPLGTGAIAVCRLSGPQAFAIADKVWRGKSLTEAPSHTAHLGNIVDPADGSILDQAVATTFKAPRSFSGDDTIEFAIHGSRWIQRQLIALLCRCGARPALPGEYTRRAYATGRMDLAEAEAVADLISASSAASHRLAMTQMRGRYSERLNMLRNSLVELASLLELELDFSEEDVEFASRPRLLELANTIHSELDVLARSFDAGRAIKDGIPVAIIGPTNAGKSSLLNALLGDDRAIVSDIHGTTRDIVEDTLEIGPYLFRIKDTAGLRHTDDTIENLGIERSLKAAATATIVLMVIDPEAIPDITEADPSKTIFVINKSDVSDTEQARTAILAQYPEAEIHTISAKNGTGLDQLRAALLSRAEAMTASGTAADYTVTNARHAAELRCAADAAAATAAALTTGLPADLIAQDVRATIHHLGAITGHITTPEILQNIFEKFCIGK
ncbi:MAG: tRNA uridine-5-carboxymethylaminomethyl(34) synthesis GTPase MnmE [Bacteroidales bacterium]|nr:tRNA uridine-5-carboxymethylaminomethyl(34) synthesis GTPase MnmE [Bacteroidales bacterium]